MRILEGIPLNSERQVIGRITISEDKKGKDNILVTSSVNSKIIGFRAILTSSEIESAVARRLKLPAIHSIKGAEILNEGDVVFLDMNRGTIVVEYEKQSSHNSILVTNRCNCRCIMCPQPAGEDFPGHTEHNLKIIKLMNRTTGALGITGGEPTLLGDGLIRILRQCQKYLPNTQIQVLTNGILLKNDEYERKIRQIGLKNPIFCVPLYADTDEEHDYVMQRNGAFEETVQGLYNLAANKQPVEIRVVVMASNFRRLPQIAGFIYGNFPFAIHVAFMGMEVEGMARKNVKKLWVSPKEYSPYLKEAVIYLSQRDMNVSIYNEQLCLLPKDIWNFTSKSISEWKNVYLKECSTCREKTRCGGFFASPYGEHRAQVRPL